MCGCDGCVSREEFQEVVGELQKVQETVVDQADQMEELREENAELRQNVDENEGELAEVKDELQEEREDKQQIKAEKRVLEQRVDLLKEDLEHSDQRIDELEEEVADLEERVEEAEEGSQKAEETAEQSVATSREIAAKVNAIEDDPTAESGDGPPESSSPMDFFLNCQQALVNQSVSENRARAVQLVRRRDEFGQRDNKGRWYFDRDAVREGLTAIMGTKPYRETVRRVWRYMDEMSGRDVRQKTVKPARRAKKREVLVVMEEADERFNEARYVGMNLLRGGSPQAGRQVLQGGVTPVVTGAVG